MQLYTGQYIELNGVVLDAGGIVVQVSDPSKQPVFTSSDLTVVNLKKLVTGLYQAQALKAGSATITATLGLITQTLAFTVVDKGVPASILINTGAAEYSANG